MTGDEIVTILANYVRINKRRKMRQNSERGEEEKEILLKKT